MKVVAINGSPHKEGNTYHALMQIGKQLQESNVDMEIIDVGNKAVRGCMACGGCARNKDEKCVITSDPLNEWIQKMKDADGIILASPVYYAGIAGTMKSFLDRAFCVSGNNGNFFRHKVGAAIVVLRRTGGSYAFDGLNHYLNYSEMILATSNYWNIVHGAASGEVLQDEEGMQIMEVLGKNMAWLLKMRELTKEMLPSPAAVNKAKTNFIR